MLLPAAHFYEVAPPDISFLPGKSFFARKPRVPLPLGIDNYKITRLQ